METVNSLERLFTPNARKDTMQLDAALANLILLTALNMASIRQTIQPHALGRCPLETHICFYATPETACILVSAMPTARKDTAELGLHAGLIFLRLGLDAEWEQQEMRPPVTQQSLTKFKQ